MSKLHRVRTHHLRLGRMIIKDHLFESLEQALTFGNSVSDAESVKVYDHQDQITHDLTSVSTDTYA